MKSDPIVICECCRDTATRTGNVEAPRLSPVMMRRIVAWKCGRCGHPCSCKGCAGLPSERAHLLEK